MLLSNLSAPFCVAFNHQLLCSHPLTTLRYSRRFIVELSPQFLPHTLLHVNMVLLVFCVYHLLDVIIPCKSVVKYYTQIHGLISQWFSTPFKLGRLILSSTNFLVKTTAVVFLGLIVKPCLLHQSLTKLSEPWVRSIIVSAYFPLTTMARSSACIYMSCTVQRIFIVIFCAMLHKILI